MDIAIKELRQKKRELEAKIFASLPKKDIEEYGELVGHMVENISICYRDTSTYSDLCPRIVLSSVSVSPDYVQL